ncbi:winged helix-turn-helix domain-containing protein [Deinococcus deserti]|uniref:Putative response regulator n=1 Tax=Deinococcus deserti (strain DSM 17065 / CIP 109153 / LMG 22923 / VCD115) TaxID=546414 RepID=C1D3W6_DEIDV|nr:winged helix-turn-helix domain-containing protein [Deinococcus deserti]ACO48195.1 putative response regulator [Deinococcus deserti VCD115]
MYEPLSDNELRRIEVLARYAVVDTLPEPAFDRLTTLAARLFSVPYAMINLIDEQQIWAKACFGTKTGSLTREHAPCVRTIESTQVMVVPDARQNHRFASHGVMAEHGLRFYAGAPLVTHDGYSIGTLCLLDEQPRTGLSDEESSTLQDLAALVMDELELRLAQLTLARDAKAKSQMLTRMTGAADHAQHLAAVTQLLAYDLTVDAYLQATGPLVAQATNICSVTLHARGESMRAEAPSWTVPVQAFAGEHPPAWTRLPNVTLDMDFPVFLENLRTAPGFSDWIRDGVGSAAFLPLTTVEGARHVVSYARGGEAVVWSPEDRQLLTAVAQGLNILLSRWEHIARRDMARNDKPDVHLGTQATLYSAVHHAHLNSLELTLVRLSVRGAPLDSEWARWLTLMLQTGPGEHRTACRLGDREYAVISTDGMHDLQAVLQQGLSGGLKGAQVQVGIARMPEDATDADALMALAEARLARLESAGLGNTSKEEPRAPEVLSHGSLTLDCRERVVRGGHEFVKLSKQECALLAVLMQHPHQVFSRERLAAAAWGEVRLESDPLVNVHISNLRRKLLRLHPDPLVHTVRGQGYSLQGAAEA